MDWWIRNVFSKLWISESGMHILNYGLVDPKFLPKAPIRNFAGFHNPECKKIKTDPLFHKAIGRYCSDTYELQK